ncbi:ATPase- F0 complex- subunit J [Apiospora aurea]|uniref:ATPase- F0 complex- subunit J n=1 Tax=Apiospora aurea TaxID=335848 RepID=A0ABR1QST0_9PEZI
MAWFGITPLKKFPTPVRAIILYGVNSAQNAMMRCTLSPWAYTHLLATFPKKNRSIDMQRTIADEWKNDARNPNAKSGGH